MKKGMLSTYSNKEHIAKFLTWNIAANCNIKKDSKIYLGHFRGISGDQDKIDLCGTKKAFSVTEIEIFKLII